MDILILFSGAGVLIAFLGWALWWDIKRQKRKKASGASSNASAVIFFAIIGTLEVISGMSSANGAPQQAVAAAIGLCFAVIPYVLFKVGHCVRVERNQLEILEAIKSPGK